MAADGEIAQDAGTVRPPLRASGPWTDARPFRIHRALTLLALAVAHLALIAMLRAVMAPRLPPYADLPRIEISFLPDAEPVPALAPPSRQPAGQAVARSASAPAPPAASSKEMAKTAEDEPADAARARLFQPDGRLALSEDLLERLDQAAERSVEFRIANLDKAGIFLRRPPIDYEPTRFDGFWVPSETLLEEWVRKGIKEVSIPIPGSSWRIVCKVSLLAPGGACGIAAVTQATNPIELAPYVPPPNRNR